MTNIKQMVEQDEGRHKEGDTETELKLAKRTPKEKTKTLKTGMRKVKRMVTKTRTITK